MLAFLLLTLRFSPNWIEFGREYDRALADTGSVQEREVVKKAFLSYSGRGYYVLRQAADLSDPVDNVDHKIIRWRLLFPALGHFLHLPSWGVLGLSQVGACGLVLAATFIGWGRSKNSRRPLLGAFCFALIAGATAPFITGMGLLGYYDAWLALGLLAVALGESRTLGALACMLTPWVDERFVIGLPLALMVRYWSRPADDAGDGRSWWRKQALGPVVIVGVYTLIRIGLGGSGGSQTIGQYVQRFILGENLSVLDRLKGALAGLRVAWLLTLLAVLAPRPWSPFPNGRHQWGFAAIMFVTSGVSLFSAVDLGRSMGLLVVVLPLGWMTLDRCGPRVSGFLAPLLAVLSLSLPAYHVIGKRANPVDAWFTSNDPLLDGWNSTGIAYLTGTGVAANSEKAIRYCLAGAERGDVNSQKILGIIYRSGQGVPKDPQKAAKWYLLAAQQGEVEAQNVIGVSYALGDGIPKDVARAVFWLEKAALQHNVEAQVNLGRIYGTGELLPKDLERARYWLKQAISTGSEDAQKVMNAINP